MPESNCSPPNIPLMHPSPELQTSCIPGLSGSPPYSSLLTTACMWQTKYETSVKMWWYEEDLKCITKLTCMNSMTSCQLFPTHYYIYKIIYRYITRGDGLAVEPMSRNPEGRGLILRLSSCRLSLISIDHAKLLRSTLLLVLCLASNHGIAWSLQLGPTEPVTDMGMTNE